MNGPTTRFAMALAAMTVLLAAWADGGQARAQSTPDGGPPKRNGDWKVGLGALGAVGPEYEGSNRYDVGGLPYFDIEWKERIFLGVFRGAGLNVIKGKRVAAGVAVGYSPGRDEDDADRLDGLGDIDAGVDGRLFAKLRLGRALELNASLRRDLSGNDNGLTATFGAGALFPLNRRLMLRLGGELVYADDEYTETYFGITAAKAAASTIGLAAYTPEGGLKSASLDTRLRIRLTGRLGMSVGLSYDRLLGDAADSPLAVEDDQFGLSTALVYRF